MATVILKVCWQHTARRNIKTIGASDRVDAASVIFRSGSGSAASGQWIESGIGVGDETIKMVSENRCFSRVGSSLNRQTPQQGHVVAK